MFVAWLMTISLFLICLYATVVIINGVKERDEYDLAALDSQLKNLATHKTEGIKQAI